MENKFSDIPRIEKLLCIPLVSRSAIKVYFYFFYNKSDTNKISVSLKKLTRELKISKVSIVTAIKYLNKTGFIGKIKGDLTISESNVYIINK